MGKLHDLYLKLEQESEVKGVLGATMKVEQAIVGMKTIQRLALKYNL